MLACSLSWRGGRLPGSTERALSVRAAATPTRTQPVTTQMRPGASYGRRRGYLLFVAPALIVITAVIIFPWIYTVFMSLHNWQIGSPRSWVGLDNYGDLFSDLRF